MCVCGEEGGEKTCDDDGDDGEDMWACLIRQDGL